MGRQYRDVQGKKKKIPRTKIFHCFQFGDLKIQLNLNMFEKYLMNLLFFICFVRN